MRTMNASDGPSALRLRSRWTLTWQIRSRITGRGVAFQLRQVPGRKSVWLFLDVDPDLRRANVPEVSRRFLFDLGTPTVGQPCGLFALPRNRDLVGASRCSIAIRVRGHRE